MHLSSYVVLKSLLHTMPSLLDYALKIFSEKKQAHLQDLPIFEKTIEIDQFDLSDLLSSVHYSWFLPILDKVKTEDSACFLSALQEDQKAKVKKNLKGQKEGSDISSLATAFLQRILLSRLLEDCPALLPKAYLPDMPLSPLLALSKKKLIELIHLLALFDLSKEYNKIIDKKTIQKLNSFLSGEEKLFLQKKRHYQDPFSTKPLGLSNFNGDWLSLKAVLHKRGLQRLAKGLSFHYFDFIWHLAHTLDIGRGQVILDAAKYSKPESLKVANSCISNILEVLPLIKNGA